MANQHDTAWNRVNGLLAYCMKQRAEHGLEARDIAQMATAAFGVPVTPNAVRDKLTRMGKWELPPVSHDIPADLLEPQGGFATSVRAERRKYAEGWEPRVEEDGDKATATSAAMDRPDATEDELIEGWQLSPKDWAIVGNVRVNRWQGYDGRWLYQYKAGLKRKTSADFLDVEELCERILKHKPQKIETMKGDRAFAVCVSDTQLGKADGDGTVGIVGRFLRAIDSVEQRVKTLRKMGEPIGPLYVFGLGDIIEGCGQFYAQQEWRTQLDRREQTKVARRLIVKALQQWAPLSDRIVVAAVGGNHGENRNAGKSFTTFNDNDDVAIWEQVQEILSANPEAYGHITFQLPRDRLDLTLDVQGTITGLAHGHQAGRGAGAAAKMTNWWKDQAHGMQAIGDAQLLLSGHWHHLLVTQMGAKTHIQAPALDGGSDWWRNMTGQDAPPGMLTLTIGSNTGPSGWSNLLVL